MTFLEIMCTILMGIVILLFLGGGMAIVFWDAIIEMRNSKLRYEGHQELVKVISKEHRYEYKLPYFMMSRDVYYPQYLQYPEEYIVNIECKNGLKSGLTLDMTKMVKLKIFTLQQNCKIV